MNPIYKSFIEFHVNVVIPTFFSLSCLMTLELSLSDENRSLISKNAKNRLLKKNLRLIARNTSHQFGNLSFLPKELIQMIKNLLFESFVETFLRNCIYYHIHEHNTKCFCEETKADVRIPHCMCQTDDHLKLLKRSSHTLKGTCGDCRMCQWYRYIDENERLKEHYYFAYMTRMEWEKSKKIFHQGW